MKLEVGMYVRTKTGIHQIYRIDNNKTKWKYVYKLKEQDGDGCINCGVLSSEDIIGEPSFEIIDVIEQGDLVNDIFVESNNGVMLRTLEIDYESSTLGCVRHVEIFDTQIKTVVTHEQLEAMAYRIGE